MSTSARFLELLRGVPHAAQPWFDRAGWRAWLEPIAAIALGGALYGVSIGAWHAPALAAYVALKLPLLLLATALVDACVNGLFARRLGFRLSFGESLRAVLLAFAFAALVLAALAPVMLLFDFVLPTPHESRAYASHNLLGLAHVLTIAGAGTLAMLRQRSWLDERRTGAARAAPVVLTWLALNLVVGAQLSWNLRPWFGSPNLEIEFVRRDAFRGTFYESVFRMLTDKTR